MKYAILAATLFFSLNSSATSPADETTCEDNKSFLYNQVEAAHAKAVTQALKDGLIKIYGELSITITEAQIDVDRPVSHFSGPPMEQLTTEVTARVNAGADSITARASSFVDFSRFANRVDTANKLGRVTTSKLYCALETSVFDVAVTNDSTKILIQQSDYLDIGIFELEFP